MPLRLRPSASPTTPPTTTSPTTSPPTTTWWIGDRRDRSWAYRPALDGLRAIAVLMVLAFHAGVDSMRSGFIGVDLFFVLSGFVVTNAVLVEIQRSGSVSLWRFYSRRVRRLMPAAVSMIIGTCLLYLLVFPLLDRLQLTNHARASLLYVANWFAIAQSNDYFAADDEASPFLHFWSLAIEEQFYFLFPVLVLGLLAVQRRTGTTRLPLLVLPLLGAASLVAQLVIGRDDPSRAYYGTDTRLYQLLVGCTLAYVLTDRPVVRVRRAVPVAGSFLSLAGFVLLGTNVIDVSPSHRGVTAAALAGALLLSLELDVDGPLPRLLAARTVLYLGTISYGIYLWHWPVILVIEELADLSPAVLAVVAGVLAASLASLSFHLLEDPIRIGKALARHPRAVVGVGLTVPLVVAFTIVPWSLESERRPQIRTTPASSETPASAGSIPDRPVPSIDFKSVRDARIQSPRCEPGAIETCLASSGSGIEVALIGDSHAQMYLPALEEIATRNDWNLTANVVPGCPWQLGLRPRSDQSAERQEQCSGLRGPWYRDDLATLDPDVVILAARSWDDEEIEAVMRPADASLEDEPIDVLHLITSEQAIEAIEASTEAAIVIIEPTPIAEDDPLACLSVAETVGQCSFTVAVDPTPEDVNLGRIAEGSSRVSSIDFDPIVCPDEPICVAMVGETPVWRDSHHLTIDFVVQQERAFEAGLLASGAFDVAE